MATASRPPTPPQSGRWTAARKAEVVEAVALGRVTREDAMQQYGMTEAELAGWEAKYQGRGVRGLRLKDMNVTRAGIRRFRPDG